MEAKEYLTHKSGKPMQASRLYGRSWDYKDKPRIKSRWKRLRQMYAWVRDHDEERLANYRRWSKFKIEEGPLQSWYREQTGFKHPGRFCENMRWHNVQQRIWIALPERTVNFEWLKGPMPKDRMFRVLLASSTYRIITSGISNGDLKGKINDLKESGNGGMSCWQYGHSHWSSLHTFDMLIWRTHMHERLEIKAKVSDVNIHRYVHDVATRLFPELMEDPKKQEAQLSLF